MNFFKSYQAVFFAFMRVSFIQMTIAITSTVLAHAHDGNGQQIMDKKIFLNAKNQSITEVLKAIEKQIHITFTYSAELVKKQNRVTANYDSVSLRDALNRLFNDKVAYLVVDDQVILRPSGTSVASLDGYTFTEPVLATIEGSVMDENGQPLPGVSILEKGTTKGATTDNDGKFVIEGVNENSVLIFSFIGYATQEITVGTQTQIRIQMQVDVQSLNEVIVVGYNTQERRDITGSISSVNTEQLTMVPATNLAEQLQGRVAGVTVGTNGQPGGNVMVRIRGIGSITGSSDPLYVIDGVPTQGNLSQLNSNDIESMQVLKDASAASIYGARASNGVVIITTKKGKAGKTQFSADVYVGLQQISKSMQPKFVNGQQYADLTWANARATGNVDPTTGNPNNQLFGNGANPVVPDYIIHTGVGVSASDPRADISNYTPEEPIAEANKAGGDYWFRQLYRTAPIQSFNLNASGGSENGRYAFSGGYFNQEGILEYTGFKRYSLRANTEFNIGKRVFIGENIQLSYTDNVGTSQNDDDAPVALVNTQLLQPVRDIAGNFTGSATGNFYGNPYATLYRNKDNHTYNGRAFGNIYMEAEILKGLRARTNLGIDYFTTDLAQFTPASPESRTASQNAQLAVTNNYRINWNWTNTLNYSTEFKEIHRITLLAGTEAISNKYRYSETVKSGYNSEALEYRTLSAGETLVSANGGGEDSGLFSYFFKADYSLADKYLLTGTVRRDGSSRFTEENRWGTFTAFSAGWRLSSEAFMQNISFINDLKIRASWGQTGNQEIDEYNQYTTYASSPASTSYDIEGTNTSIITGYSSRNQGNPDAQWEAQVMTNVGFDATLWDSRITVAFDAYNRESSKLLLNVPRPATDGQKNFPAQNVGEMVNKGIDVLVGYNGTASAGELTYGVSANWSTYSNEVTRLYGGDDTFISGTYTRTLVGEPISSFYGYTIDGFFQSQEEADAHPAQGGNRAVNNQAGRWKFRDRNNDGAIDSQDQGVIGSAIPKFTYGLNLSAAYKGFDVSLFLQGVYGNDLYNDQLSNVDFLSNGSYPSERTLDTWTPDNRDAALPALNSLADSWENQASTYFVEKGSYLRFRNAQIGFSLPTSVLSRISASKLRFYVQASNFLTITDYRGLEPEVNVRYQGSGSNLTTGVDQGVYPLAKMYLVGLQLGF